MAEWKVTRRTDACSRCEREFEEEEVFFSVLLISEEEVRREDACGACFTRDAERPEESQREHLIFWRSRRRLGKKAFAVDFEALEGLFLALEGRSEAELREVRYLLSLLLMRKKRVKLVQTVRREDGEAMVLRRPRRTEELLVYVYDLTPDRTAHLRDKLQAIFEGAPLEELMAAPAPARAPAAEDSEG